MLPIPKSTLRDVQLAGRAMGLHIEILNASTSREIDAAFATFVRERPDALIVSLDPFLNRRAQLVNLASRHAIPTIYSQCEFADVGGLMGYGASVTDAYRQAGVYAGRILKGSQPASLPVAGEQVRVGHQPDDRKDARPHSARQAALDRRRGDRVNADCCSA
jgi:putative tryptophan/tyrosine transport system substrate-binding protein